MTARAKLFALTALSIVGCAKEPGNTGPAPAGPPSLSINQDTPKPTGPGPKAPTEVDYNIRFDDAVTTEVLEGYHLPPDVTFAGKKTGLLRLDVEKTWPTIVLVGADKRPLSPRVDVETSEGMFTITLNPLLSPTHARNFLALAKVGFYDGLRFERNVHQEADFDGGRSRLDLLIGGCPTGTGDDGYGHLGYFLPAEPRDDMKHEEGTVGFWHEENPDSAGTRFYITLGPAPALDGKFTVIGKVTSGLDVVRQIGKQPVRSTDPASLESEKPVVPAGIRKMTVSASGMEK